MGAAAVVVLSCVIAQNFSMPTREWEERAEKYRTEISLELFGKKLPDWRTPAPLTPLKSDRSYASVSFAFNNGLVRQLGGNLYGSAREVTEDNLPHEITHMLLASYFKRPIPRWADEGLAMLSESEESQRNPRLALRGLSQKYSVQYIINCTEYPPNVTAFYAQSYALTNHLVKQGGKRKFVSFLGRALQTNFSRALQEYYNTTFAELDRIYTVNQYCGPNGCTVLPPPVQIPIPPAPPPLPEKIEEPETCEPVISRALIRQIIKEEISASCVTEEAVVSIVKEEARKIVKEEIPPIPTYFEIRRKK